MNANRGLIFGGLIVLSLGFGMIASAAAPANQPPTFLPGPNQVVFEDSGDHTVVAWASEISPGSAAEAGQSLTFLVTVDNPFLFSSQPAIDASGTLTFTPAQDAFGTANVTVTLHDDGGLDDNGQDTSAPHLFQIQITAVNDPPVADGGMNRVLECSGDLTFTILDGSASYDVDDVALSFVWYEGNRLLGTERELLVGFGQGEHIVTLVVTDPGADSSQSVFIVSVADTTGPSVSCSTNITVDATNSAGAIVMFAAATATDCSSIVTIRQTPSSGSTFPPGTNVVVSTAVDLQDNSGSCNFLVIVRGSRAIRRDMLFNLTALRSNSVESVNQEVLYSVINRLGLAVLSPVWMDDNHLDARSGAALFAFEKQTVLKLERIAVAAPGSVLTNQLTRLVRANRLLAETAVDEAQRSGGGPTTIAAYRKVIVQGDSAAASARPRAALARYQDAWRKAIRLQRAITRGSVQ